MIDATTIVFTNLRCVAFPMTGLRAWVTSLHLDVRPSPTNEKVARTVLSGFGSSCAWLVFDIGVDSIRYDLDTTSVDQRLTLDGLEGPLPIRLIRSDPQQPIDIRRFDNPPVGKVAHWVIDRAAHFHRAPNMPGLLYAEPPTMANFLHREEVGWTGIDVFTPDVGGPVPAPSVPAGDPR